ncbi:MAG: hypothetical protein AAB632_00720 [Patescibacteria group bacterium]
MQDDKRIKQIQKLLDVAEGNLQSARNLLLDILGEKKTGKTDHMESAKDLSILNEGKVIEGVFDGEQMVAPDGKKYPVPANYASKSKLVEGDTLKLTIADDGSLIYKQINPTERKNLIGTLSYDNGNYTVLAEGKSYKVLFASVTYYKGEPGSKASIIVPVDKESTWAALESIIHEHGESKETKQEKNLELPEENKEILEEVKESFDKPKKTEDKEESSTTTKKTTKKVVPKVAEPEISEDMTVKEASQASAEEEPVKTETIEEHPDIKKQGAYMPEEDDSIGKEEKETNSIGEESPIVKDKKGKDIQELEI